ncbi:LON peptidase substrate-binding domain-containing protein [soil metagenome]|nr:LON peptidase substrate-binding domain-containing protein [Trueperaceae bacterium]
MQLPVFPLDVVAFPGMTVPLFIFEARYRRMVKWMLEHDPKRFILVLARPHEGVADGAAPPIHRVGTVMDVLQLSENVDGTFELLAHGQERVAVQIVHAEDVPERDGSTRALYFSDYREAPLQRDDPNEELVVAWDALDSFRRYARAIYAFDAQDQIDANLPEDLLYQASFVCANVRVPSASRQVLLEAPSLSARFRLAQKLMEERIAAHRPASEHDV